MTSISSYALCEPGSFVAVTWRQRHETRRNVTPREGLLSGGGVAGATVYDEATNGFTATENLLRRL